MTEVMQLFRAHAEATGISHSKLLASWMRQNWQAIQEFSVQAVTQCGRSEVILAGTRKRLVVAFSGLGTKPSIMMPFLRYISDHCETDVVAYPGKMPLRKAQRLAVLDWGHQEAQKALDENIQVASIGWSAGGRLANLLGGFCHIPSVCIFTSQHPDQMLGGQLLQRIAREKFSEERIPRNGRAVVEGFSLANRTDTWNKDPRVTVLKDIQTHLAINHSSTCQCVAGLLNEEFEARSH